MSARELSGLDKLVLNLDQAVRTLLPGAARRSRTSPAAAAEPGHELAADQRRHSAGLMRINHTGEVCAQALYQGQAATARLQGVRDAMEHAAVEEEDHLAWCEQRLRELGSHTSLLNPLFYAASFGIGATAGLVGDKWSLGFVAATEEQVCKHLREHLQELPDGDERSRAILQQMLEDEAAHATRALEAGGAQFPAPVKAAMTALSKVMTATTYRV